VITPENPERMYSTRLRTALVLTGSGTAGAYHAGVLRALHEAGVKIDIVAGRGVGAAGAYFAAVDGGARLWDDNGVWRGAAPTRFYRWRAPLRVAGWALVAAASILAIPLALLALAVGIGVGGLLLTLIGLDGVASTITTAYGGWIEALFAPTALPTIVPRLVLFACLVGVVALVAGTLWTSLPGQPRRRTRQGLAWRLIGAPLSPRGIYERLATELWNLIRGAAPLGAPPAVELARRYAELLIENLGQPGFRELIVVAHDMDARRDFVFALLADGQRSRFFGRPVGGEHALRATEAFDLAGVARDHALDPLAASLAVPIATEPHLITLAPEGPWRGETHRLCDRPGSLARLLEEVAAAGAEQVILVSASPHPARAHELSSGRADLRGRAGEQLAAFEAAGLRDIHQQYADRFNSLVVIRPVHNPLGPLDLAGVYDERSDRRHTLGELVDRGYEDAYRQFIEPIVGGGGERMQAVHGPDGREPARRRVQL
jgi:hypothetical protein